MNYQLISPIQTQSITEQLVYNRGFSNREDILHYLNLTEDDDLGFEGIEENLEAGLKMLVKHLKLKSKIFIQVDPDVDGYTSAAILINYLYRLFPDTISQNVHYRIQDGKEHGLILDTINTDIYKLVIAPDSSSNDYEVHKALAEKGVDVLVIDHHNAEKISEYACVINNQLCNYKNKTLSGAGVVYKFCRFIDKVKGTNVAKDFVDLAALGIISDMMDIRDFETRYFIDLGLNNIFNRFFHEMTVQNSYSLKDKITPNGIAFYITPYINACIRTGTPEEKMTMFEAMLDFKGEEKIPSTKRGEKGLYETRITQACRNCKNAKNRQKNSQDRAAETIEEIIVNNNLNDNKILLIQLDETMEIDKNLTGLIANKLMSKYQKPVLLLRKTNRDGILKWEGSGRGYTKSGFEDFQSYLKNLNLFDYVDGHENAFGRGIIDENIEEFISVSNNMLKDFDFTPKHSVDFIFDSNGLKASAIEEIANLEHLWGQGMTEPVIAIKNIKVKNDSLFLLKGTTLKFSTETSDGKKIEFIKFGSNQDEYDRLKSDSPNGYTSVDIVGKCSINTYMGLSTPQIKLEDYEIKRSFAYDF